MSFALERVMFSISSHPREVIPIPTHFQSNTSFSQFSRHLCSKSHSIYYTFSSAALLPSMATDGLLAEYCTAWPSSVTQRHLILTQLMTYIKSILKLDDQMAPATQRQLSTRPVATGRVALTDKTRTKTDEQNKFIKIIIVREISLL